MNPKVTILGSGTCVPRLERSSCSVLVEINSSLILLDMGPGTIRRLLRTGKGLDDITHICISHFHPDHSAELAAFLFASKYGDPHRQQPLSIVAGPGFNAFFKALQNVYGQWIELGNNLLQIREVTANQRPLCFPDFELQTAPVAHNPESVAFRINTLPGYSIVYSGDTDYCNELADLAVKADLLICESSTPDEHKISGHLTPSLAGQIASTADVAKLVLTHFYPVCDSVDIAKQCRTTYKGPLIIAEDLLTINLDY